MIVICCVCHKVMKENDKDKGVISHSYCKKCLKKAREEAGLDKKEK